MLDQPTVYVVDPRLRRLAVIARLVQRLRLRVAGNFPRTYGRELLVEVKLDGRLHLPTLAEFFGERREEVRLHRLDGAHRRVQDAQCHFDLHVQIPPCCVWERARACALRDGGQPHERALAKRHVDAVPRPPRPRPPFA